MADVKAQKMKKDRRKRHTARKTKTSTAFGFTSLLMMAPIHATSAELLMFQEDGGFWSEAWDREVADIYHKTLEGKAAPLRRLNYNSDVSDKVSLKDPIHFAPTFVLVEDGREIGRIEGYPGADFFWQNLEKIIQNLSAQTEETVNVAG